MSAASVRTQTRAASHMWNLGTGTSLLRPQTLQIMRILTQLVHLRVRVTHNALHFSV